MLSGPLMSLRVLPENWPVGSLETSFKGNGELEKYSYSKAFGHYVA
jgi:hypothetical protein